MEEFLGEFLYLILTVAVLIGSAIVKMFNNNKSAETASKGEPENPFAAWEQVAYDPGLTDEEAQQSNEQESNAVQSTVYEGKTNKQWDQSISQEQEETTKENEPTQSFNWREGIIMSEILNRKHFSV